MSILDDGLAVIMRRESKIENVVPHTVVQEVHDDSFLITQHPVERGATISDHAFKLPARLEMSVGWSDSSAGEPGFVETVYAELLNIQAEREPIDVFTYKREYSNMLIQSISVVTDEKTNFALMAVVRLQEVLITNTQTAAGKPPQSAQGSPQRTASPANGGVKQLVKTPSGRAAGPV